MTFDIVHLENRLQEALTLMESGRIEKGRQVLLGTISAVQYRVHRMQEGEKCIATGRANLPMLFPGGEGRGSDSVKAQ